MSYTGKERWKDCQIDKCLVPLIKALNNVGIYTTCCCCGHGNTFGLISLADGRELLIAPNFDTARKMEDFSKVNIQGELKPNLKKN